MAYIVIEGFGATAAAASLDRTRSFEEGLINGFDCSDIATWGHHRARQASFPVILALFFSPGRQIWRFQTDLSSCQQPSPDEEQVAEREQCEQMRPVLCQTAIPRFHVTELALDYPYSSSRNEVREWQAVWA
jgi:hypothetical protein